MTESIKTQKYLPLTKDENNYSERLLKISRFSFDSKCPFHYVQTMVILDSSKQDFILTFCSTLI